MNKEVIPRALGTALGLLIISTSVVQAGSPCEPAWDTVIGSPGLNGSSAFAIAVDDAGVAFFGGSFTSIGAQAISRIASWDGASWSPLGSGVDNHVRALHLFDGDLVAGGIFTTAGGQPASRIARWDGAVWSAYGSGADGTVFAFEESDISGAARLYAGGLFLNIDGVPAKRVASWDGAAWSPLGSGVTVPGGDAVVYAIKAFDLGNGPRLAVGGVFTVAGGQFASNVAVWDGVSWSPMGSGTDGAVRSFEVFDDGSGPALYAGGDFDSAGGIASKRVARWDGAAWSAVGAGGSWGGGSVVRSLMAFDDGDGERLIAGGLFVLADGASAPYLAAWDGAQWAPAFGGADGEVFALLGMDPADAGSMLAGGAFAHAGAVDADAVGRLVGCSAPGITGDINGDGLVDTADLGALIANFGTSNPDADLNDDGIVDTADLGQLIANFGA